MLGIPYCNESRHRWPRLSRLAFWALLTFSAQPAAAWWTHGHSHITAGAIEHLPQPLREFFDEHGDYLSAQAASEPPGSHWIDIDNYPSFFEGNFPREYDDVVAMYGESYVQSQGTAPWTFAAYIDTLSDQMAAAVDGNDWIELLDVAAAQAHYIEDLHNPFHLTRNYNGQYTGNRGIHARYEGEMIVRHLDELTFSPTSAEYLTSVLDFVFDGIDLHYPFVADVLAADDLYAGLPTEEYYSGMWNDTGAFTQVLFQEASEAVANSWYTAWINAGSPTTFLDDNADFDGDSDVDGADFLAWQRDPSVGDLTNWQADYGTTPTTIAGATSVPEPSTFHLLGTVGMLLGIRRRW